MDDDTVLRTLGEDLARDDPRLAALLSGSRGSSRQWGARSLLLLLLVLPVLTTVALLVPPTVAVGVLTMLLAVGSPLAVCWLVTTSERTPPRPR
jgi:hypothetical protein